jgi:uncharacterized protein (DUF2252 family)
VGRASTRKGLGPGRGRPQPGEAGPGPAAHLHTRRQREEIGRTLREACPRESHAAWTPPSGRADPVAILQESSKGRVERLVPIRYGRMVASPFAFYRGAAAIMAADLAATPSTGYQVQACGDCHLLNFGAFATPERRIIFDINDFDETFPAPWEWDLKRLAASFVIASLANGHSPDDARAAARSAVFHYAEELRELAAKTVLDAWYSYLDYNELIKLTDDEVLRRRRKQVLRRAMERTATREFAKLGHFVDGKPKIREAPPLVYHPDEDEEPGFADVIARNFALYRESLPSERRGLYDRYELADVAMKVVGVGSVGTVCAVALFLAADNDPLFLQIKEARASVLEPYAGKSVHANHGQRVVAGQRLMQSASDVFLGWTHGTSGRDVYIRQLRDMKMSAMIEDMDTPLLRQYGRMCAHALARAHARSGDAPRIAGYMGSGQTFDEAVGEFAVNYADQNQKDYRGFLKAIREGRIEATFEG